jgi:hypothetical protein
VRFSHAILILTALFASVCKASGLSAYYWRSLPVGQPVSAQLLTLFCHSCGTGEESERDIPLVSVLRDTLGDEAISNHRVTAVWLLTYSPPTLGQRVQAAIPFFYWTLSDGSAKVQRKDTGPLLDLSAPEHPAVTNVERQLLQWTALDTVGTPVRAASRAYRTNEVDHERVHLEEANSYLLHAPAGDDADELTVDERDFVMARLDLRKKLLGGFASSSRVTSLGREQSFEDERVRSRNWELLRLCAEKTGLAFEPLSLAGSDERYATLWYRLGAVLPPGGAKLGEIWKLLNIKDPYSDDRLKNWSGVTKMGAGGTLIPLGVYSLSYPRQPLLMVDFRDKLHVKGRDLTQKSMDEITSGVVGLSHFTNWYYFVAADLFDFLQERRGKANNRAERLDSYSEFRVALALDRDVAPALRGEMQRHMDSLSSNPLETSPSNEMKAALARYLLLSTETAGDNSRLVRRMVDQRREELAGYGIEPTRAAFDIGLHVVTLGGYTHRAKRDDYNVALLSAQRRADFNLAFLDRLVAAGTPPEVAYQAARVRASVAELSDLLPAIDNRRIRMRAQRTLQALAEISNDGELRADCRRASQKLMEPGGATRGSVPGVLASAALDSTR